MIKLFLTHLLVINRLMLTMLLLSVGCVESNTEPEIYERDKCYEGTFIRGDCPSIAFVQLINSDLGTNWTDRDTVYQNVLVIKNYPDSLVKSKEKIFFTIDVDGTKNKDNCLINDQLCPQYIPQITDVPSVCIKSISTLNCN